ncbi:putative DNA-binding SAP protein [Trachipleistophora hominis]|uniref:Putative DNA-binding SAP protein n=1 Tax=Trachipleistophora hominis TaxID=72359 RepID=L7JYN5_TRAHO|nr:putative DNA-binding SAP protein [Trachipleistophora hominis]
MKQEMFYFQNNNTINKTMIVITLMNNKNDNIPQRGRPKKKISFFGANNNNLYAECNSAEMFGYNYGMNEEEIQGYGKEDGDSNAKGCSNDGYYGNYYNYQPYNYDMNGCYENAHNDTENGGNMESMESAGMAGGMENGGGSVNHGAVENSGMSVSSNMSHISNVNSMKRKMGEGMSMNVGMGALGGAGRGSHVIGHESGAAANPMNVSPGNGIVMNGGDMGMIHNTNVRLGNNVRIDSSHRQEGMSYGTLRRHDDGMSAGNGYANVPMNANGMVMPKMGANSAVNMNMGYNQMEYPGSYSNAAYNSGLGAGPGNDNFGYNLNHVAMNGNLGANNMMGGNQSHSSTSLNHPGQNQNGGNFQNCTPNMGNAPYNGAYYNYPYQNCPATPTNSTACTPYNKAPATVPATDTNNLFMNEMFMGHENAYINPWMNKKKRKNNPLLWQYIKQHQDFYPGIMHPSKYSSLDFVQGMNKTQKMYLGSIKRMPIIEKNNSNSILPLYLNSASILENSMHHTEFMRVSKSFFARIKNLDYENVTVQQLKNIMKEFGLNHTGKKIDLIERVKSTKVLIGEKLKEEKADKKGDEKESTMDSLFF